MRFGRGDREDGGGEEVQLNKKIEERKLKYLLEYNITNLYMRQNFVLDYL